MKTNQMAEIENVRRANSILRTLIERTKSESVGIGLFYGRPGIGKTRWALKTALDNGFLYLRLIENMTVKDFLKELLRKLKFKHLSADMIEGTQNLLYENILDYLHSKPETVIFIDEIDYAFHKPRILASIRDIADQSLCTVVLVGMENAKSQLTKLDAHYFDRCNGFCKFQPLTKSDVGMIAESICEVGLDAELIEFIYKKSNGTIRVINKYIENLERFAKKRGLNIVKYDDVKAIFQEL